MSWPFFDAAYLLIAAPAILVMLCALVRVRSAYDRYSREPSASGLTGSQVARRLLDCAELGAVAVEVAAGELSDHYDPRAKVLRLSPRVYQDPSIAAVGIAAHEVGHAVQDHVGYAPMRVCAGLIPVASVSCMFGYVLFVTGFVVQFRDLVWLGALLFSAAVVFALVTLPVELNASGRALQLLRSNELVREEDAAGTKAVLSAASLSYVAALLHGVGQLIYWVLLALGVSRGDD